MQKQPLLTLILLLVTNSIFAQAPFLKYQEVKSPTLFEPGIISKNSVQWNNSFDKNGNFYFTRQGKNKSTLMVSRYTSSGYIQPEIIPLDTNQIVSDIFVNSNGKELIYMSTRENEFRDGFNLWRAKYENGKWTEDLYSEETSKEGGEAYPWLTESGNLYFSVARDGSRNSDIYVLDAESEKAQKLPGTINSEAFEGDAYVAPDESFIIFAGFDRSEGLGLSDLYISFQTAQGWSKAKWMGKEINSEGYDGSPVVSPDGNYLVFTSSRASLGNENIFFNHYIVPFKIDDWKN